LYTIFKDRFRLIDFGDKIMAYEYEGWGTKVIK